ncbi:N-acyl homoserine lactonase family protein [Microbacterium pseudoresistens]|uniref:Glyoxylase-like metal-dependent hydrolase (Beta-lactamase superfamily II) n=1 Tax=Microbacterium pseudoresistens TaxID=640634 RepID=A0A7Y9JLV3_9MICO|nr:N-acyl homoserine lactonase family protein [Microbacterium pseudoresistens]NYD54112.1 glyoxylase-like metal-dependent hydrolase (beta-lactamase superfamily II) [Microbacterium pseudoresistens]
MAGTEVGHHWEVLIVRYATWATSLSDLYLHHGIYGEPDGPGAMDYYFWIARNGDHTVVIDTGYRVSDGDARGRTTLVDPRSVLAELVPQGQTDVVVTHCHYDHVGNLGALPGSRVFIARDEYEFWTDPIASRPLFSTSASTAGMAELERAQREGRLTTFSYSIEIQPGVTAVRVGGHTPGQSIVFVDTADGRVLLASDSIHLDDELELDRPFRISADLPAHYRALELARRMRDTGEVTHVITGHQPGILAAYPPAGEGPDGLVGVIGRKQHDRIG